MMAFETFYFFICFFSIVYCAPRTGTTYDQKQTGDYNFQVHLKDFQIIAVLSDDTLNLGDYDYNYDYSDLTIKPGIPTGKPTTNQTNANTTVITTTPSTPIQQNSTTIKLTTQEILVTENLEANVNKTTGERLNGSVNYNDTKKNLNDLKPEQIKVKIERPVTSIAIVPSEDVTPENDHQLGLGEIMHNARCTGGYVKDKRGRCRKIRRPPQQLPFSITQFASRLASKFRKSPQREIQ